MKQQRYSCDLCRCEIEVHWHTRELCPDAITIQAKGPCGCENSVLRDVSLPEDGSIHLCGICAKGMRDLFRRDLFPQMER